MVERLRAAQAHLPLRWRLVGAALAAVAVLYLYFFASPQWGGPAYWLLGAILLGVGLFLGFRAWLFSVVIAGAVYLAVGYLFPPPALAWETGGDPPPAMLLDPVDEPGLVRLREEYRLAEVVAGATSDRERVSRLAAWTSRRFSHSSDNQPSRPDPLTILQEAAAGRAFRCVEYSTVLAAAARSLGMPSRVLGLKRADVETARYGGDHVVAEVWLRDEARWVMADGQWNALVEKGGQTLPAVEVRRALAERAPGLRAVPADYPWPKEWYYLPWLQPYLYYFDYTLDQRFFVAEAERLPGRVMLVPSAAPELKAIAGRLPLADVTYLHNPALFYLAPE